MRVLFLLFHMHSETACSASSFKEVRVNDLKEKQSKTAKNPKTKTRENQAERTGGTPAN